MAVITAAAIGAIGSAAGGLMGSGSGDASKLQRRAINRSQPLQTTLNIPGLGGFSVSGGKGAIDIAGEQGQFGDLSTLLGGLAQDQAGRGPLFDLASTGFTPGSLQAQGAQTQDAFGALQQSITGLQSFDQDAFAASQFDRLQSLASRGEDIAANRVGQSLFSRGRLGGDDTASGAAFEGLARAQEQARTQRALDSFGLADQAFQQRRGIVQDQLGALQQSQAQQQLGLQGFQGLQGLLSADQQQSLQNILGLGIGAGQVLDPVFRGVETAVQTRLTDQANRVSAATGAAGAASPIISQGRAAQQSAIGNVFGGLATAVADSDLDLFGGD